MQANGPHPPHLDGHDVKQRAKGLGKVFGEVGKGILHGGNIIGMRKDEFVRREDHENDKAPDSNGARTVVTTGYRPPKDKVDFGEKLFHMRKKFKHIPDEVARNPFGVFGCNYVNETEKEKASYLNLDGIGLLHLSSEDPLPLHCKFVCVNCTSVFTGFRKEYARPTGRGWEVRVAIPDRLCDVLVEFQDVGKLTLLVTGFQVPAGNVEGTELTLPIIHITHPGSGSKLANATKVGQVSIKYTVSFDRQKEYSNLFAHPIYPKMYIEPPTAWDDIAFAANAMASQLIFLIEDVDVVEYLLVVYDILFWNDTRRSGVVLLSAVAGISFVGIFHLWLPLLLAGVMALFWFGRIWRPIWDEKGRKQSKMKPRKFLSENPEIGKWGVSTLWLTLQVVDGFINILTWKDPIVSSVALGVAVAGFCVSVLFPLWFWLDVIVAAILVVPGMSLKLPVLWAYLMPAHLLALYRRQAQPRPFVGRLTVTVHEAHSLRISDFTVNDPYCAVMVGPQHQRTHAIVKTSNPIWNEDLQFIVFQPNLHVQLWMWDWDRTSGDDFMGEALLHIQAAEGGKASDANVWLDVTMRPCKPLDFHLFLLGRVKVSWSLEDITAEVTPV